MGEAPGVMGPVGDGTGRTDGGEVGGEATHSK